MGEHFATVVWQRGDGEDFTRGRYSRVHEWRFDGGSVVRASAAPANVRAPWSATDAVDPEEAFVAALASCHMLWFLSLAAARGFVVERYEDAALGTLGRRTDGIEAITRVELRPCAVFDGAKPDRAALEALHHEAHARCFIAHSVRSEIVISPRDPGDAGATAMPAG